MPSSSMSVSWKDYQPPLSLNKRGIDRPLIDVVMYCEVLDPYDREISDKHLWSRLSDDF